jgi:DNA-binding beta-propeller fold protein YncE
MFKISRSGIFRASLAFAAALALAACEEDTVSSGPPPVHGDFAFVTTTDFQTGSASIVTADDSVLTAIKDVASPHSDAVARAFGGLIYVLNRQGADNVQVIDPLDGFRTRKQFSVGNGADPEDIVFQNPSRAFVSRYNEDQIWIVNPKTGQRSGLIDFSWLADADLVPEMAHMVKVGNRVFVAVRRLDRTTPSFDPTGTSYVAVFDATTQQFLDAEPGTTGTQAIELATANPFGEMVYNAASGKIWVPTVGFFGLADGGVELLDPVALTTSGIVISETTLGGDITDVVALDANRGAAIVSDSNFNTLLVGFDLSAPAKIDTIYAPGSFALQDAERSRDGRIFLSDRSLSAPGIRVFRGSDHTQITTNPIDVGLPPADIEFVLTN